MVRIVDKGNGKATVLFTVEMPMQIYDEFKYICEQEYSNTYWLYIKDLMMLGKVASINEQFMSEIQDIREEIAQLKEQINKQRKEEPAGLGSAAFRK